jgi:hypothetical protein
VKIILVTVGDQLLGSLGLRPVMLLDVLDAQDSLCTELSSPIVSSAEVEKPVSALRVGASLGLSYCGSFVLTSNSGEPAKLCESSVHCLQGVTFEPREGCHPKMGCISAFHGA